MISAEARSNWLIAQAPLMYARYVYVYSTHPGSQFLLVKTCVPYP